MFIGFRVNQSSLSKSKLLPLTTIIPENLHLTIQHLDNKYLDQTIKLIKHPMFYQLATKSYEVEIDQITTFNRNNIYYYAAFIKDPIIFINMKQQIEIILLEFNIQFKTEEFKPHITLQQSNTPLNTYSKSIKTKLKLEGFNGFIKTNNKYKSIK